SGSYANAFFALSANVTGGKGVGLDEIGNGSGAVNGIAFGVCAPCTVATPTPASHSSDMVHAATGPGRSFAFGGAGSSNLRMRSASEPPFAATIVDTRADSSAASARA